LLHACVTCKRKKRQNKTIQMTCPKKKSCPRHILLPLTAGTCNKSDAATYFLSVNYVFTKRFSLHMKFSPEYCCHRLTRKTIEAVFQGTTKQNLILIQNMCHRPSADNHCCTDSYIYLCIMDFKMHLDYIFQTVMVGIIMHSHYKECHIYFQIINRNLLRHVKTMWSIQDIIECNVQASMCLLIYISIQQWEDSNYTFCGLTDCVINTILRQCWLCGSIS